jgi:RNA-directed DNA polymerase
MNRWSKEHRASVARAVAAALLAGDWEPATMAERGAATLGRRPRWLGAVVREAAATYRDRPIDRPRELTATVERELLRLERAGTLPRPLRHVPVGVFSPAMGRMRWPVPALDTPADLAAMLDLHMGELHWLSDRRGLERRVSDTRLQNYRYRWLPRRGRRRG